MENQFQTWLKAQGYYRKEDSLMWWKNGEPIHGSELSLKFKEWEREMNKTSVDNYLLTARDQVQKTKKSKQSWMQQILLRPFYLLLKKDMIRLLSKKHGEQFIDDVMQTFGMPTNLMDKYYKPRKNQ